MILADSIDRAHCCYADRLVDQMAEEHRLSAPHLLGIR
jgi:hypothetical protein